MSSLVCVNDGSVSTFAGRIQSFVKHLVIWITWRPYVDGIVTGKKLHLTTGVFVPNLEVNFEFTLCEVATI